MAKFNNKLLRKFYFAYVFIILLPTIMLSAVLYSHSESRLRAEYIADKRALLLSDKAIMESHMLHVEEIFRSLNSATILTGFLERQNMSDLEIIYSYHKEIDRNLTSVKSYDSALESINIYSANEQIARLLPEFSLSDTLPKELKVEDFSLDRNPDLVNGRWLVIEKEGCPQLTYYAAIMDSLYTRIVGIVELRCVPTLFDQTFALHESGKASYLFGESGQLFSRNTTVASDSLVNDHKAELLKSGQTAEALAWTKEGLLSSRVRIDRLRLDLVSMTPLPKGSIWDSSQLYQTVFPILAFFVAANLVVLPTIFQPLRNISLLARHMRDVRSHKLQPYKGRVSRDEVRDLIESYNYMAEETNRLANEIRHNETLRKNAQIDALQAQINPHFFYGTLESIRMIAEMHHESLISDITFAFGNLMRYSLSRTYFVSFKQEIDIVRQYLDIQNKRLADRFFVNWHIQLIDEGFLCPKFILFTMVENIFSHSISQTRQQVLANIYISQQGEEVVVAVQNDGPSIPPDRLALILEAMACPEKRANLQTHNNGQGVFNIHDRLQLYYGSGYGFGINSTEREGTVCTVRLRRLTAEEEIRFCPEGKVDIC